MADIRPQLPHLPKTSLLIDIEGIPAFPSQNWTVVSAELAHFPPVLCGSDMDPSLTLALSKAALGPARVAAVSREKWKNGCGQPKVE